MNKQPRVAFALGGLGGANAFGAGFLQAAKTAELVPCLISCTSGQILQTFHYLRGDDLEAGIRRVADSMPRLPEPFTPFSMMGVMTNGVAGVFRPAALDNMMKWMQEPPPKDRDGWFDRMLPARVAIPTRPPEFFEEVAHTFNQSDIGIIFNSYSPLEGIEYLHINEAARVLLAQEFDKDYGNKVYKPITPDYVQAALWLLQYGFDHKVDGKVLIDGAYRRQFIVREMVAADAIFIPHPISRQWLGRLPENHFEVEDMKIQLLFTGSYNGEISAIKSMNYFLQQGMVRDERFKVIDLIEVQIENSRGFFDYFFEAVDVFRQADKKSAAAIAEWRGKQAAAGKKKKERVEA